MRAYDPGREAAERYPEWRIVRKPLRGAYGMTVPRLKLIVVDADVTRAGWDCTVAHELEHLDNGERCTLANDVINVRRERAVCLRVARRLVPLDALADIDLFGRHPHDVAEELGVDVDTLRWRIVALKSNPCERVYVNSRLAAREVAA